MIDAVVQRLWPFSLLVMMVQPASAINEQYSEATICDFPTSLHLGFISNVSGELVILCSGVYVGNGLMLTAAHCAIEIDEQDEAYVYFGEDWQSAEWSSSDVECVLHPGGRPSAQYPDKIYLGPDIAYCKLDSGNSADPWPEPPIVPVMVPNSCENDFIRDALFSSPPSATTFPNEPFGLNINKVFATASGVGFNDPACELTTDAGCTTGIKRYVDVPIRPEMYITSNDAILFHTVQPDPVALLPGDSGGPLYFRMFDGSWRLIGLAAANDILNLWNYNSIKEELSQDLFNITHYTAVPRYVGWIENSSGRDITPCHTYDPTTNRWDFTGGPSCADNVPTSSTAGDFAWIIGNGQGVNACLSTLVSEADACAGWTPPPFEPPLALGPPTSPSGAALTLATEGQAPFSEPVQPQVGFRSFGSPSAKREVLGTPKRDLLAGTIEDDIIIAGQGRDIVWGRRGDDDLLGGDGNDLLKGGPGNDLIFPGPGRDAVHGGFGNDTVVIGGSCELEAGEVLLGGAGQDTLISPLSAKELWRRGVVAHGFEKIAPTHPDSEAQACDPPASDFQILGGVAPEFPQGRKR